MDVYEFYKPLRNQLRQVPLLDSLAVIYAYLQNLQFDRPIPNEIEADKGYIRAQNRAEKGVFEWDLELLAKEVILNSPDYTTHPKSFSCWDQFSDAVNKLRKLEEDILRLHSDLYKKNILLEMYRLAHRQFPWQLRPNSSTLIRHFRIFSHPVLDGILQRRIGLTARQLYTLGLAFIGHYVESFALDYPPPVAIPGIDAPLVERFISRFATDVPTLRNEISANQSYDEDYAYALNPLRMHPLLKTPVQGRQLLIAPVPTYLFRRFTEGVYYEIYDDNDFSAAFGNSFQTYVGDVLRVINDSGRFLIAPEHEYFVGKNRKDSVDWIVADEHAALFIECKTKRLRYASKIALSETEPLDKDLAKMASFVVQAYKTQADCLSGHYLHWKPETRQIFPVVVTLEEWYAFGDKFIPELNKRISDGLREGGVDPSIMESSPYTICSVADFEIAVQIMNKVGVQQFMVKKTTGEKILWSLGPFMHEDFPDEGRQSKTNLFPDDYKKIHPLIE